MKQFSLLALIASTVFIFSCGEDNEPILDFSPDDPFDARLNNNATDSLTATVFLSDIDDNTIDVLLSFTSTETMRRVYVTRNEQGQGFEKVDASTAFGVNDKGDGSIDLSNDLANGFSFDLDFTTAGLPTEGTVVYNFWATSAKGDFRDTSDDLVVGVASLTIQVTGDNPATQLISQENIELFAPTADLMSQSFISSIDGMPYDLDDFEFSDLWDIGYTAQGNEPQFSSAEGSPQRFFDPADQTTTTISFQDLIERETGATELNAVYFVDIEDTFDFDGATVAADLAGIQVSNTDPQTIDIPIDANGDLIAFVDQYGKIGVIRIDQLVDGDGDQNFFESNDYVQFDIKVQP